jgi:hypothetical protein
MVKGFLVTNASAYYERVSRMKKVFKIDLSSTCFQQGGLLKTIPAGATTLSLMVLSIWTLSIMIIS